MDDITVDKDDLIHTLVTNREEHRSLFLQAQEVYRRKWIEELEQRLKEARDGDPIERAFRLPVPEDHTDDFDTAISMLRWHQGETVEISHRDFLTYVENDWGWKASFAANTQSYLAE